MANRSDARRNVDFVSESGRPIRGSQISHRFKEAEPTHAAHDTAEMGHSVLSGHADSDSASMRSVAMSEEDPAPGPYIAMKNPYTSRDFLAGVGAFSDQLSPGPSGQSYLTEKTLAALPTTQRRGSQSSSDFQSLDSARNYVISGTYSFSPWEEVRDESTDTEKEKSQYVPAIPQTTQHARNISDKARKLVDRVPFKDIVKCANFINSHPTLLQEDGITRQLLAAAKDSLRNHDDKLAENYVEKALIIKKCQGSSGEEMTKFLRGLYVRDAKAIGDFDQMFNDVISHLRREVAIDLIPSSHKEVVLSAYSDNISLSDSGTEVADNWMQRGAQGTPRSHPSTIEPKSSLGETLFLIRPSMFFNVGRVFAILSSEHFDRFQIPVSTGMTGRTMPYERVLRFAVVKERHGFCLAVPISTYNGRGLSKLGFNEDDIHAHAIIHLSRETPHVLRREPLADKEAVSVDASSLAAKLSPASRINFAKTNTIEHNVRAMDIGRVSARSMPYFQAYWREEILR